MAAPGRHFSPSRIRAVCSALCAVSLCLAVGSTEIAAQSEVSAGESPSASTPSDAALEWLRAHPVIRVGAEINYAPYEFRDARGRFTGVVADYLDLIRRRLGEKSGVRFEVVQLPDFGQVETLLRRREVDIVLALTPSKERADYLAFTRPYLQYVNVVVTRDNHDFVTGLADFSGRPIAVVRGHSAQQLVARAYPAQQVVPFSDILEALMAVSTGKVDGLVDDIFPVVHNIRHRQIGNLKLATPVEKALQASGFSIAVRSDWPELVALFDNLLDTVTPQESREISQKWLSVRVDSKVDYRAIWSAAGVFSALLVAAVLWIRQLRRQRAALEAARAQAEAANRAKDSFLAGMSHELRTPLHAILGYADLLREGRVQGQARADALTTIASSGRHLLALINDLLDLSRIRSGHLELRPGAVDLRALIDDVAAMTGIEARRKGLTFTVHTADALPAQVEVDDKRLRQVLLNLLGNAIKFTDHGAVEFSVRSVPVSGALIRLTFQIDDTGKGIDPADRERIFAPFEQGEEGRRRETGVGLGLAISREIVQCMRGDIDVETRAGGGSRFSVTLVLPAMTDVLDAGAAPAPIVGIEGAALRILAVDDQAENIALVEQMLRPLGFDVRTAAGAAQALEAVRDWQPHLVLMDLRMPGTSGFDCASDLRRLPGMDAVPMVAASASAEDLTRAQADGKLFAGRLRKPFHFQDLVDVLDAQLDVHWRRAMPPDGAVVAAEVDVVSPPIEYLREIKGHAQLGKWVRIEQIARDLAVQGERYAAFVRQLRAYARDFDEKQLERFVDRQVAGLAHPGAG